MTLKGQVKSRVIHIGTPSIYIDGIHFATRRWSKETDN